MNGKPLAIGIFLFAIFLIGYVAGPSTINQMMGMFTPGGTSSTSSTTGIDPYRMMGIPRPEEMAKMAQYSFLGLMLAGIGVTIVGVMSKKKPPKKATPAQVVEYRVVPESELQSQAQPSPKKEVVGDAESLQNQRTLAILEERLARGEITTKEYVNLKKLLTRT